MRAMDLADKAYGGDEGDGGGDAPAADDSGDMELEALMTKFAKATRSGDAAAMAAVFRQAMEACG